MKKSKFLWLFIAIYVVISFLLGYYFSPAKSNAVSFVLTNLFTIGLFLFIIFFGKKKSTNNSKTIIIIPSLMFNNRESINISSIITLCTTLIFFYYSKFVGSIFMSVISIILLVTFAILMSPLKMVLSQYELVYDKYWKEKWENIKEYKISDGLLQIVTKDNKKHTIKKINKDDINTIDSILKEKVAFIK